jgi:hypothetical protein
LAINTEKGEDKKKGEEKKKRKPEGAKNLGNKLEEDNRIERRKQGIV